MDVDELLAYVFCICRLTHPSDSPKKVHHLHWIP